MLKYFFFCVIFASIFCLSHQFGRLFGGAKTLTEKQFLHEVPGNIVNLIDNDLFQTAIKNHENKIPFKYYSYICGTQQVCVISKFFNIIVLLLLLCALTK